MSWAPLFLDWATQLLRWASQFKPRQTRRQKPSAKYIKRRHFYVRDMVEAEEIIVPLVRTDDNAADFLTKPMTPEKFVKFRDFLMNIKTRGSKLSADAEPFVSSANS